MKLISKQPGRTPKHRSMALVRPAEAAITALMAQHGARLRQWGARYVTREDAEDLLQDALAEVWSFCFQDGAAVPADPDAAGNFLYSVYQTRMLKTSRDQQTRARILEDHIIDLKQQLEDRPAAELDAAHHDLIAAVERSVQSLPPRTAEVYRSIREQGLSVEVTAALFGCKRATVWWHLNAATHQIRNDLERDGFDVPRALKRGRRRGSRNGSGSSDDA